MPERLEVPIFPLHTVLYPGGVLPLKIFEQRYLEMTKACLRDGSPFGVCRIREGREVGLPAIPEQIGCTAMIQSWEMPHPGMFQLQTRGVCAFRILESGIRDNGLIQAQVEMLEDVHVGAGYAVSPLCRQVLGQAIQQLGSEFFPPTQDLTSVRWVSYRLAEVLPLPGEIKQALLEERKDAARLEQLHALLATAQSV
ncbi:MAG: LON peptidase substrate-binding domain-containing protein [Burkholderiales bacterium]